MTSIPAPDLRALSAYDYDLPEELIAQSPAKPRDSSRLMVLNRAARSWEHRRFRDLPEFLKKGDLLVANNTRVIPARLLGQRLLAETSAGIQLGGKVEFLLLEELRNRVWEGAFHASAKHKPGVEFLISTPDGKGLRGRLIRGASDSPNGTVVAEFDRDPVASGAGSIPLPPYIGRASGEEDRQDYQTVYAKEQGSAAAPTAGLHFTDGLLKQIQEREVQWAEVTLHVGLGTFRPVKNDDIRQHVMHQERFEILASVADQVAATKQNGGRVIAVGTTSVRAMEGAAAATGKLVAGAGRTDIFIYPGGQPLNIVDGLITNFHLPKSTLLMLLCALAGHDFVMSAYREAVAQKYRFFSYGDAMLIL